MKIEVLKEARMSTSGEFLLRIIQNNSMPTLDLLVREAVQNSLDASNFSEFVNVDMSIKEFDNAKFNHEFEGITDALNNKFGSGTSKLLAIRDSNTVGLTGPLRDSTDGNLQKLVYQIGRAQNRDGAGGSWGLGKTVYFRIGIGLVLYYSRIKNDDGSYSSRFAACLVEDQTRADSILALASNDDKAQGQGVAWWGVEATKEDGGRFTVALTDESEINQLLNICGITAYQNQETGTTIIIPYINEEKLLSDTMLSSDTEDGINQAYSYWWKKDVANYISIALQRWYAPRFMNRSYNRDKKDGSWLRATVNGKGIASEEMIPIFKVIQELYNQVHFNAKKTINVENSILKSAHIYKEEIVKKKDLVTTNAGYIVFTKLNKSDLKMKAPENHLSPFSYVYSSDIGQEDSNPPIIMYTRKPGMIVSYEKASEWTKNIPQTSKDEFIIGLFVLNSTNTFRSNPHKTLEWYIRKSEEADHTSWQDWSMESVKSKIVFTIQKQVRNAIKQKYSEMTTKETEGIQRDFKLAKKLAEFLLPPTNFGKVVTPTETPSSGPVVESGNSSRNKTSLKIENVQYIDNQTRLDFKLVIDKKTSEVTCKLVIRSEGKPMSAKDWETEINRDFPLKIMEVTISDDIPRKSSSNVPLRSLKVDNKLSISSVEQVTLKLDHSGINKICSAFKVNVLSDNNYTFKGTLTFKSLEPYYQFDLLI